MLREMQKEDYNLPFMPIRRLTKRIFPFLIVISGILSLLSAAQLIYISNFPKKTQHFLPSWFERKTESRQLKKFVEMGSCDEVKFTEKIKDNKKVNNSMSRMCLRKLWQYFTSITHHLSLSIYPSLKTNNKQRRITNYGISSGSIKENYTLRGVIFLCMCVKEI